VKQYCYLLEDLSPELLADKCSTIESLSDYLHFRGREAYLQKKAEVEKMAPGLMQEAERYFVLTQTDNLWKEHLQALKFVQQAVGLRGYAQREPLIEYKLEGYNLFLDMMAQIRRNVIYSVYQFKPVLAKPPEPNGAPMDVDDDSTKGLAKMGGGGKKDETQSNGTVVATANGGGDSKGNTATARSGGRR